MSDSDAVTEAINTAWMHVFGSSFPDEKYAGGKTEMNQERVIDEMVTGVEALWQYARREDLSSVVEDMAEDGLPEASDAEAQVRAQLVNEEGEIDAYAFKELHNEVGTACDVVDDLVVTREQGF